jgi:hypothetical protein
MKRSAIFLLILSLIFPIIPVVQAGPLLSGVQIYPQDYVWNVPVDSLPLDAKSSAYVNSNHGAYLYMWDGFPINVVDGNTAKQRLKSITHRQYSDDILYPVPASPLIQAQSDHHLLIVDKDTDYLYEMYHAHKNSDGTFSAGVAVSYDLTDYTLRDAPSVSADAAGLPLLPGLIRYEEVEAGSIDHALRFAADNLRNTYIWPARGAAGSSDSDASLPPHGQRFRLKASFDTSGYSDQEKIILAALKKYGMILADWNGGDASTFHVCAAPDSRWAVDFSSLYLTDFEAVDESSLMIHENSGQTRASGLTQVRIPTAPPDPSPAPTTAATTMPPVSPVTVRKAVFIPAATAVPDITTPSPPKPTRSPEATIKIPTPWPTDTPAQPSPVGMETGLIAIICAVLLGMKRK